MVLLPMRSMSCIMAQRLEYLQQKDFRYVVIAPLLRAELMLVHSDLKVLPDQYNLIPRA